MPDANPLLCWCCARWGLAVNAIDAAKRLCQRCLNSSPSACDARHKAQALAAADKAVTADA